MKRLSSSEKTKFSEITINKGVELLMGGRRKPRKGNYIKFAKMVSLFGREIHFSFELSLLIKKKSLGEGL